MSSHAGAARPAEPDITGEAQGLCSSAAPSPHVVGYVSRVTQADLDKAGDNPDPLLLHPGFRIGKQGVEKAFDLQLRGKPGGQKVEVDSRGRTVREDPAGDLKPTPGDEVVLTLDADIQDRALEVFGIESWRGGDDGLPHRRCDVPDVGARKLRQRQQVRQGLGLSAADYNALAEYDRKPLFNKALTATYPPGSTFKTMVALAALEHGYDPKTVHVCNKVWFWGGRPWHCDQAHGAQDLHSAIATSCDIYFYQCALAVGPDRIAEVARKFGLGAVHDIGLPTASSKDPGLRSGHRL